MGRLKPSEPTADGGFELDGLPPQTVFLFARGEGFRFHGQMLKPRDGKSRSCCAHHRAPASVS